MICLPDKEWILGWTQISRWDSDQEMTKLFTAKTCQFRSTWKKTSSLSWLSCTNMGSLRSYPSQSTIAPFCTKKTQRNITSPCESQKNQHSFCKWININSVHSVSILSDVAQRLAGKSLFCKLDCFQAYHCLQMADQWSVEMLPFSLLSKNLPTWDFWKVLADLCLLYEASCVSTKIIRRNCQGCCIRGRYWICSQHSYGSYQEFLGSLQVFSPIRIAIDWWKVPFGSQTSWIPRQNPFIRIPTNWRHSEFYEQIEITQIEKSFPALSGFCKLLQSLYSQDVSTAQPILQILRSRSPNQHHFRIEKKTLDLINKALNVACQVALKQPIPGMKFL